MFKHRHNALLKHPGYNYGGGGSGGTYYKNAEELYGVQADTAKFMYDLGKQYVPGAVEQYKAATDRYADPAYEAEQVGKAVTSSNTAFSNATGALKRDMARYGVNPASGKFGSLMNQNAIHGAAMTAGAANTARSNVQDKRFGVAKDFYSNLVGMPSDAASTAGSAAGGYAQMGANKDASANQEAAGWGSAIGLGTSLYNYKDGGEVKKDKPPQEPNKLVKLLGFGLAREAGEKIVTRPRKIDEELKKQGYKNGGCVDGKYGVKMARGGLMPAFGNDQQPLPPPPAAPQQGGGAGAGIVQGVQTGKKLKDAMSGAASDKIMGGAAKGIGTLADVTGNTALAETALNAAGASSAVGAGGVSQAGMLAAQNAGMGVGATAATAEALGAGTAAAGEAAAAASPALSAISTAIPWIGAAAAIGSMFDLFADGGEVRDDMTMGGEVDGPGTKTSDDVPAWLSDGEYVLNAEAVQMVGKDKLDRINEAGLAKRGDQDKMPSKGPDGAMEYSLGSFIGGLATGYTTGQRIKADKEEREYRREEMKDRREERDYQRKKRAEREQLGADIGAGMEQAQAQAAQSGGTLYKAGEMVFDNKEDQQAALGILAKEDARIKQQPGFGVNPDAAKFLEQQPELAELRKPKMDADYLFYTSMWPKLKARYAKVYGVDKAMDMDNKLKDAADKNHSRRILDATALEQSGDKAGAVQKWAEIWNRDLPNGTFANATLRGDGNVDMTVYDMTGRQIDKQVMPYPDAISLARTTIGTQGEQLKALIEQKKKADDAAYYKTVAGLGESAQQKDVMAAAAAAGKDPLEAAKNLKSLRDDKEHTPKEIGGDVYEWDDKKGKYVKTGKLSPKPATTVNYTGTGGGRGGSGGGATGEFARQTVEALTPLIGKEAAIALAYGKGKMTMPADKRVSLVTGLMKQTDMMGKPLYDRTTAESLVDSMFDFGTRRVGGTESKPTNSEYNRYKEARQRAYAKGDMDGVRRMDAQAKRMGITK